jgi:hypothetical protein
MYADVATPADGSEAYNVILGESTEEVNVTWADERDAKKQQTITAINDFVKMFFMRLSFLDNEDNDFYS